MPRPVGIYLLIRRVGHIAVGIAYLSPDYAINRSHVMLGAPEAPSCEVYLFHVRGLRFFLQFQSQIYEFSRPLRTWMPDIWQVYDLRVLRGETLVTLEHTNMMHILSRTSYRA